MRTRFLAGAARKNGGTGGRGGPHTAKRGRRPRRARGLIEVSTFKVANVVGPARLLRATLFIYLRHIQLRPRDRKTDCAPRRCRATGIRDAICMQILSRRCDSARGRIRAVTNPDRARARAGERGRENGHSRRGPLCLRVERSPLTFDPRFDPAFLVIAHLAPAAPCRSLLPATRRSSDVSRNRILLNY